MHRSPVLIACVAAALPCAAQAQQKILPGLWDHTFSMKSESGRMEALQQQMQAQLAALPPAQRQQLEGMMAQRGVALGPKGNSFQVCVSKEDAASDHLPQADERCQQQTVQREGDTVRFKFSCNTQPPASGEGQFTVTSPKSYQGSSTVNTVVQGQPERMVMSTTGRWVGSDCGSLKPRGPR